MEPRSPAIALSEARRIERPGLRLAVDSADVFTQDAEENELKPAYQQQRYLRTAQVQIMARIYGEFYHARGPTAELRYNMLHGRTKEQSYDGIAWLYGGTGLGS